MKLLLPAISVFWLTGCAAGIPGGFGPRGGIVSNKSDVPLWVVETDSGYARAHRLEPGRRSPTLVDADALRAVGGESISAHPSWWKIVNVTRATVRRTPSGALVVEGGPKSAVGEWEFGKIHVERGAAWGEPVDE